jgi:hypothetical protein
VFTLKSTSFFENKGVQVAHALKAAGLRGLTALRHCRSLHRLKSVPQLYLRPAISPDFTE